MSKVSLQWLKQEGNELQLLRAIRTSAKVAFFDYNTCGCNDCGEKNKHLEDILKLTAHAGNEGVDFE